MELEATVKSFMEEWGFIKNMEFKFTSLKSFNQISLDNGCYQSREPRISRQDINNIFSENDLNWLNF